MKLWTYHPAEFRVDDRQSVGIDPSRGQYWNDPKLCYKPALQSLLKMLSVEQFPLWCFTVPDGWILTDVTTGPVEWELSIPEPEILAFIREPVWDAILKGCGNDWGNVIVKERPLKPEKHITAVVPFPLSPEWRVTCHGQVVPEGWRKQAEFLTTSAPALQQHYIDTYRDHATDMTRSNVGRALAARRADYLQDRLGLR